MKAEEKNQHLMTKAQKTKKVKSGMKFVSQKI